MNRSRKLIVILAVTAAIALTALPAFAARGTADFTRYVALGDSLAAGSSNANPINMVITHQMYSYPSIIARQAGTPDFEQPLISEPGILPELELKSLVPLDIEPKSTELGVPLNLYLARPYNNLGIPGATVGDLLTKTGAEVDPNPAYQLVLRGRGPAVGQALALSPTFITVWIGNNDVLGAVTGGTPAALTPLETFTAQYNALLDALVAGAPNAGMVVATVPPVLSTPFANTVPPFLVDPTTRQPILNPANGDLIYYIADLGGGNYGQLSAGDKVTLRAQPYIATGYGIPAALAPYLPPLPNIGKPLPDSVCLTKDEQAVILQRLTDVNAAITAAATARDIPVIDAIDIFTRFAAGLDFAGIELDTSYLTGGIISYDGFHPTDIGYTLIANEFIRKINASYNAEIPMASLVDFFQNNAPASSSTIVLPRTMSIDLFAAPWTRFTGPIQMQAPAVVDEPAQPTGPRRTVRRPGGHH